MTAPFDGLRPTPPGSELRARVLAAALAAQAEAPHWIDVLWESRGFRLALGVAFALAIVANPSLRDWRGQRAAPARFVELEGISVRADLLEPNSPLPVEAMP